MLHGYVDKPRNDENSQKNRNAYANLAGRRPLGNVSGAARHCDPQRRQACHCRDPLGLALVDNPMVGRVHSLPLQIVAESLFLFRPNVARCWFAECLLVNRERFIILTIEPMGLLFATQAWNVVQRPGQDRGHSLPIRNGEG